VASAGDRTPQIDWLYQRILSRPPQPAETALAGEFLRQHPNELWLLAQSLLMTNEFSFVD